MTSTQTLAIVLYSLGAVAAIAGPLIAAVRTAGKYREAASELTGTWNDPAIDPDHIRATAKSDAWWGVAEFGLVALGVVLASIASIVLVVAG